jgi:hypothetical protein
MGIKGANTVTKTEKMARKFGQNICKRNFEAEAAVLSKPSAEISGKPKGEQTKRLIHVIDGY